MTIGQLIFGGIAICLAAVGIIVLLKKEKKELATTFAILSFFVAIIALLVAIFDPTDTPKIRDVISKFIDSDNSSPEYPPNSSDGDGTDTEYPPDLGDGDGTDTEYPPDSGDGDGTYTEYPPDSSDSDGTDNEYPPDSGDGDGTDTEYPPTSGNEEDFAINYDSPDFPETSTTGNVEFGSSYYDINGYERTNVIYMEGGSSPSITIYTNEAFSNISFNYYAISGMDPTGRNSFKVYIDNYEFGFDQTAGISESNPYGAYSQSIVGAKEVKIEFTGDTSTDDNPCALLLSDLIVY